MLSNNQHSEFSLSMFLPVLSGISNTKQPVLDQNGSSMLVVAVGSSWTVPSVPKKVYRNCESVPSKEVRMRLPGVYRMIEDCVYPIITL